MKVNEITQSIQKLKAFWGKEKIVIDSGNKEKVENFKLKRGSDLPSDFKEFYSHINGMDKYYPNYSDENGFLFYPIEFVNTVDIYLKIQK